MTDFLQERKKILFIVLGILVAVLFGLLAWRAFNPGLPKTSEEPKEEEGVTGGISPAPPASPPTEGESEVDGTLPPPPSSDAKLLRITDFPVVGPALNKTEDRVIFYKKSGGDFSSRGFNGENEEQISNLTIIGLIRALHSPLRDRRAIFTLDDSTLKSLLHIGTSTLIALPANIESFSWSPDGKSIAYLLKKEGRLSLVLSDAGGKTPREIYRTPLPDAAIQWVLPTSISFVPAPSGIAEGYVFLFSTTAKSLKKLLGPLYGLTSLWSPDGRWVLVGSTKAGGRESTLSVFDAKGKEAYPTGLSTFPEKCAFTNNAATIYCAVPRAIPADTTFPDAYLSGEVLTADRLVRINIAQKTVIDILDEDALDMIDLVVTKNEDYLFFVNRVDGTLWRVKLK